MLTEVKCEKYGFVGIPLSRIRGFKTDTLYWIQRRRGQATPVVGSIKLTDLFPKSGRIILTEERFEQAVKNLWDTIRY